MTKIVRVREVRKGQFEVVFNCDNCANIADERKSHFQRKQRHFCKKSCYSGFRRDKLPVEEQHRYRSGNSPEERAKRRKARSDLNYAVRCGLVEASALCEADSTRPNKPEAHHENYDRALDVIWLCRRHHMARHKAIYENPELLPDAAAA
jgi:hypothetical protein